MDVWFYYQFTNNFSALLLCVMNGLDIFNTVVFLRYLLHLENFKLIQIQERLPSRRYAGSKLFIHCKPQKNVIWLIVPTHLYSSTLLIITALAIRTMFFRMQFQSNIKSASVNTQILSPYILHSYKTTKKKLNCTRFQVIQSTEHVTVRGKYCINSIE